MAHVIEAAGMTVATGPYDSVTTALRRSTLFRATLDGIWPSLSPEGLVRELLDEADARSRSNGLSALTLVERRLRVRPRWRRR